MVVFGRQHALVLFVVTAPSEHSTLRLNHIWSTLLVGSDAIVLIIFILFNNALCVYMGLRTSIHSSLVLFESLKDRFQRLGIAISSCRLGGHAGRWLRSSILFST